MNEISTYTAPSEPMEARGMRTSEHPAHRASRPQNISDTERWASLVGGSAMVLLGLPRGRLGGLLASLVGGSLIYRGATGHCSLYEGLGLNTNKRNPQTAVAAQQGVKIEKTITVNRSPEELYAVWRDLENLPRIMRHLEQVDVIDQTRSQWKAKGPLGKSVEWRAEILTDRGPEVIAWRSLDGGDVDTAGSVHFQRLGHGRGTALSISLKYDPPGGKLGATIASLFGQGLEQELAEDLRRFKSLMEAGEAPSVQGQPHG